jgi:hypothetical protein
VGLKYGVCHLKLYKFAFMNQTDWIGSIGVSILLLAYFFNLFNKISKQSFIYLLLNIIGASLACIASVLLHYWPFIILEACWAFVSIIGLGKKLFSPQK